VLKNILIALWVCARDGLCACSQTSIQSHPDLAPMKVCEKKFPTLRHCNWTSPSIYRHKLQWTNRATISEFDSRQVLNVPKASLLPITGVVRLMQYKKGDLILQHYHCGNFKSRNARKVCFISVSKT